MTFFENQKSKNLLRFGCGALVVMLTLGTVPFLRGFAAGTDGTAEPITNSNSITDGVLTIDESGTIEGFAYNGADNDAYNQMTTVKINADDVVLNNSAFNECEKLSSIIINGDNVKLNGSAINACSALTSVTVNGNDALFCISCLDQCGALTSVTVNGNNAKFDRYALYGENNVATVIISGSNPSFNRNVFSQALKATITFECPAIKSYNCFTTLTNQSTVHIPCSFTVNGTTVTLDNASDFFAEANVVIDHNLTKTNAKAATCTENGNIAYWTCDDCNKIFSDEEGTTEITEADTVVAALGHDFHDDDWTTVTEATETTPGEEEHFCHRDGCGERESREIPTRPDDYQFTADSLFKWAKGSTDGLPMVIKNTSGDDTQTYDKLKKVSVDGAELTLNSDYTAEPGSIKLTLSPEYLETLATGKHTLSVELTVTTLTHTFTVVNPASTDTPATGESILLISVSLVLMFLAAGGAAFALIRRRRTAE